MRFNALWIDSKKEYEEADSAAAAVGAALELGSMRGARAPLMLHWK